MSCYKIGDAITTNVEIQTNLVKAIITIVDRFKEREYENPHRGLKDCLNEWMTMLVVQRNVDNKYMAIWDDLVEDILTTPQWFYLLFPDVCRTNENIIALVKRVNNEVYLPPDLKNDAYLAKQRWVKDQSDISNEDSLISYLILKLTNASESEGAAFEFFSGYFTFKDMLYSYFVNSRWKNIHKEIFGHLYRQHLNWSNSYCHGYAYQGFEKIGISGIKPTEIRMQGYDVDDCISENMRILDIGSNCGFMSLYISEKCKHVDAIEYNPYLTLIGEKTSEYLNINNVSFIENDFYEHIPEDKYDAVFSLANHATIDEKLVMNFEEYISKIFYLLNDGGYLFFETHNVFGPGTGGPGDDGDLDAKFDIVERYFDIVKMKMTKQFVTAHDIDKLFIVLKRKPQYKSDVVRKMDLASARLKYDY